MSNTEKPQFLLVFRSPNEGPDPTPEEMQQIFGKWMAWMKGMKAKGQYVAGARLEESGKVLHPGKSSVTDGPYVEAKETVGGYIILSADNLAQAAEIAKGCPGLDAQTIVEIRPIENLPPI
jgi:hypothetical protein